MANAHSELEQLEAKINVLLDQFEKINTENNALRNKVSQMHNEKQQLVHKNESARKQIDLMIQRLKSM